MKVLFITGYMYEEGMFEKCKGGINLYVTEIARGISTYEDIEVFALTHGINRGIKHNGINYIRHTYTDIMKAMFYRSIEGHTTFKNRYSLRYVYHKATYKYFDRCIKELQPDIVHIHGIMMGIIHHIKSCEKYGIPVLVTLHGLIRSSETDRRSELGYMEEEFFRYADAHRIPITVVSSGVKEMAKEMYKLTDDSNIGIINNGIELKEADAEITTVSNEKVIVHIGRICHVKNQIMVLNAMEQIFQMDPKGYKLIFIGLETDGGELRKLINSSKFSDSIEMLEFISHDDVMRILKTASLNIIASKTEAFGLTSIEAMSVGVPTVMFSDLESYADLSVSNAIFPIEKRDVQSLSKGILSALEYNWDRKEIIQNAKKFSMDKIVSEYINEYEKVRQSFT